MLSIQEFSQLTPGNIGIFKFRIHKIAAVFLDRVVAPELLPSAIEDHFRPYLRRPQLHLDDNEILIEYCMHIMHSFGIFINSYPNRRPFGRPNIQYFDKGSLIYSLDPSIPYYF